ELLHPDPRSPGVAANGAGHGSATPALARAARAGRCGAQGRSGHGAAVAGNLRPTRAVGRGDPGRARRGATHLWCTVLHLQPGTREHFLAHLARDWPQELVRYEQLYARVYLNRTEAEPIRARVAALRARFAIADRRPLKLEPAPLPVQLPLAI